MKKTVYTFILLFISINVLQAQSVSFPDDVRTRGYYDRPYKRYEAEPEKCQTNGVISPATFDQREIQSEASNQIAIQLTNVGDSIAWINDETADGLTLRFSIPDNAEGTGTTGQLALYVDNVFKQNIDLNSYWAWQYAAKSPTGAQYLNNTPAANRFARMRFDEVRVKLGENIPAGASFKLVKENNEATYTIDFVELEPTVKNPQPVGAVVYLGNGSDLANFVDNHRGETIYIPEKKYNVPDKININGDNTKLIGAGVWYTEIYFTADPSTSNRGVSSKANNVEVDGFYLNGVNNRRYVNHDSGGGVGKGLDGTFGSNSTIKNVWAVHFECGAWIANYSSGGVSDGLHILNCRFRDNYADGINLCKGTKNAIVEHTSFRNNGDDDMASWSQSNQATENNTFQYNTSENNWRAAAIGFFGGKGNKALNCVIIDAMEGGVRANNDFDGAAFSSDTYFEVRNISIYRAGSKAGTAGVSGDLWGNRTGALYINSSSNRYDVKNFIFSDIDIYDSKGDAILIQSNNQKSIVNVMLEKVKVNTVSLSTAGNDWTYFGLCFLNAKGTNNLFCVNYENVSNETYQIPNTGFLVTSDCADNTRTIRVGETIDLKQFVYSNVFNILTGEEYVSVDENGIVSGLAEGTAEIQIFKSAVPEDFVVYTIIVNEIAVKGISLPATLTLAVGETYQLVPELTPENATNQVFTWSSSSTARVMVASNGLVTAKAAGTANITVTTQDGGYKAICVVTITPTSAINTPENTELQITACGDAIQISGQAAGETISVYSLLGAKVFSQKLDGIDSKNIRGLREGIYTVVAEKARVVKKVIIIKQ